MKNRCFLEAFLTVRGTEEVNFDNKFSGELHEVAFKRFRKLSLQRIRRGTDQAAADEVTVIRCCCYLSPKIDGCDDDDDVDGRRLPVSDFRFQILRFEISGYRFQISDGGWRFLDYFSFSLFSLPCAPPPLALMDSKTNVKSS
jgi:hypothetical protein